MKTKLLAAALLLAVSAAGLQLGAQVLIEPFRYPPGTVIPNWKEVRGDWKVIGVVLQTYVVCDNTNSSQFLARQKLLPTNGVIEVDAVSGVRISRGAMAGVFARGIFSTTRTYYVAAALLDASGDARYDTFLVGETPRNFLRVKLLKPVSRAQVRLVFHKDLLIGLADLDGDGTPDLVVPVRTQAPSPAGRGLTGLLGASGGAMDNFNYYDAVLRNLNKAQPGRRYQLLYAAPPAVTSPVPARRPYVCGSAFFDQPRVVLGSGRAIPLFPDALTVVSLLGLGIFVDFTGFLNANHEALPYIRIPPEPGLIGLPFHTAGVTVNRYAPDGIGNISNNLWTVIVR